MAEQLPPGSHRIEIEVGGLKREYLVRVPKSRPAGGTYPVVLLLHGTGGTIVWTQQEARFDPVAERDGVVVVYPQALPPDPSQPPRFLANPPAWEDGRVMPGRPLFDDIAFFRALLDDLPSLVAIDPTRIYATGFSNGASMCFRLAAELSDRIAAIAPIAGYFRQDAIARPVPTLFIIGEVDPMVPPKGGEIFIPWTGKTTQRPPIREMLDRWATLLGDTPPAVVESNVSGVRTERYPGPVEMRYVTVQGLGHHWPGGRGQLKRELAGPWNNRLDGNEAVWRFFSRHRLV
jgi:polyhydroxybutyrate depolymerase